MAETSFVHEKTGEQVTGKRMVVWLPEPVHRALKTRAASEGETLSGFVRAVLETVAREDEGGNPSVP